MPQNVLIVDDDRILRHFLQHKLKKHVDAFTVLTAEDGRQAVAVLNKNHISLVATDLKMPEMDGFGLLAYLSEHYPDIPVIVFTALGLPEFKKSAIKSRAFEYMEKPIDPDELAKNIIAGLAKESEGGMLQSVTLEMFSQLVEMEGKTCTIHITNKITGQKGVLFFKDGVLYEARIGSAKGTQSAYEIFSWSKVSMSIQDICQVKTRQIGTSLQSILMDAMRIRDEKAESGCTAPLSPAAENGLGNQPQKFEVETPSIQDRLDELQDEKKWLKEIYYDDSWNKLMSETLTIAKLLKSGKLKCCFFNRAESSDYIVLPGEKTIAISVSPGCPHDKIMQVLSK